MKNKKKPLVAIAFFIITILFFKITTAKAAKTECENAGGTCHHFVGAMTCETLSQIGQANEKTSKLSCGNDTCCIPISTQSASLGDEFMGTPQQINDISDNTVTIDTAYCEQKYGITSYAENGKCVQTTREISNDDKYDQTKCDNIYGEGYVPNSDGTGCDLVLSSSSENNINSGNNENSGNNVNGGLPGNYNTSINRPSTSKCGTSGKFVDIGGVCFPNNTGLSEAPVYVIFSNIFSWLIGLFTTLAVLAFVVSGVQYFISSTDEDMTKSAKKNATNAVIGIIVGLSGFVIIRAIAAALTGQGYFF